MDGCLLYLIGQLRLDVPMVGRMLGYYSEYEIHKLRAQVSSLQESINELKSKISELSALGNFNTRL